MVLRVFILFCILFTAVYPEAGLKCNPDILPVQFDFICLLDFLNSIVDSVIFAYLSGKFNQQNTLQIDSLADYGNFSNSDDSKSDRKLNNNEKTSQIGSSQSEYSQTSCNQINLDPKQRHEQNDREFWKYVRIQIMWNTVACIFLGSYQLLVAAFGTFELPRLIDSGFSNINCVQGVFQDYTVWLPNDIITYIFVTMFPIIIIMSATFDYVIFFSIPYKYNRLKKSQAEINIEVERTLKRQLKQDLKNKSKKMHRNKRRVSQRKKIEKKFIPITETISERSDEEGSSCQAGYQARVNKELLGSFCISEQNKNQIHEDDQILPNIDFGDLANFSEVVIVSRREGTRTRSLTMDESKQLSQSSDII